MFSQGLSNFSRAGRADSVVQSLFEASQKTLVVHALCLEEIQFELLAITTQLGGQSVALALELPLADRLILEVFE